MKADLNLHIDKQKVILADLAKYNRQSGILSFLRLISFLAAAVLIIWGGVGRNLFAIAGGICLFILFVILCIVHGGIISRVEYLNELNKVNDSYIARIKGDFNELRNIAVKGLKRAEDIGLSKSRLYGTEFEEKDHDYCMDLDLFGKKSLFSLFNVSETSFGRRRFADSLLKTHTSDITREEIISRQKAVEELCSKADVLMDYQATARCGKMYKDPKALLEFAVNGTRTKTVADVLGIIGCVIWIAVPSAYILFPDYAAASIPACLIANLIIWLAGHAFNDVYARACEGMPTQVRTILKLYVILENAGFENELISSLIKGDGKTSGAFESLKSLNGILRLAALRSQPLFAFLFNLIAPLDYLIAHLMGKWAEEHGKVLPSQIDALAELESLMCAAQTGLVLPLKVNGSRIVI